MPESGNLWGQAIPSPQKASATPTLLAPKKARKKRKHAGQNQPGGGIRAPVTGAVPVGDAVETLGRTLISGVQVMCANYGYSNIWGHILALIMV